MKRMPLAAAQMVALVAMLSLFAVAFGAGCAAPAENPAPVAKAPDKNPAPDPPTALSPITGKPVVKAGSPVAVSIDNYPDARPQSGLSRADIVYEILAEGGITRYLALFHSQAPKVVGPVRSARPYFALLAKEWGALFAHCGGDPKDIEPIGEWNVVDADEFKRGDLYWRDSRRQPPHNLYTGVDNLRKITDDPLPAPEQRYEFQDWSPEPAAGLLLRYAPDYAVQYKYAEKKYERWILARKAEPWLYADLDTEEKPEVANVIVQFAKTRVAYSDGGLIIDLIGEGRASYLLGGRYSEGTWRKEGVDGPTIFYGPDGKKIVLTPGQTWVQIVPKDATVSLLEGK